MLNCITCGRNGFGDRSTCGSGLSYRLGSWCGNNRSLRRLNVRKTFKSDFLFNDYVTAFRTDNHPGSRLLLSRSSHCGLFRFLRHGVCRLHLRSSRLLRGWGLLNKRNLHRLRSICCRKLYHAAATVLRNLQNTVFRCSVIILS